MQFRLAIFVMILAVTLALAAPVSAHAVLVRSSPEANAGLDVAPGQVELVFTEPLEPSFSAITVLDSTGARVDNNDSRVDAGDPTRVTVSLRTLPAGVYTVSWRVLSTADGHVTAGTFPFAVGSVDAAALSQAAPSETVTRISFGEVGSRWMTYLAAAALTGGLLFMLAVWQPVTRAFGIETEEADVQQNRYGRRLTVIALIVALAGSVLGLLTKAGQAAGAELAAPWDAATASTLLDTRYGVLWLLRFCVLLLLMAAVFDQRAWRPGWLALGASLFWPLTISLGSHAATEPQPILPVLADWAHLVGASAWIGGLMYFVAGLWSLRGLSPSWRTQLTAVLIPRFSALALTSVSALTLTGLYSAFLRVGTWANLTGTLYGQVLVVKLGIALPMLALGAVNLLMTTPRMKRAAEKPEGNNLLVRRFQQLVTGEVTLGVALLLSVGLLTSMPPARAASSAPGFNASASADDLTLTLNINPGRVGVNTFALTVTSNGQPVTDAKAVELRFTPQAGNLASSKAQLAAQSGGNYGLTGAFLSLPDTWQVQAVVRRQGKFDAYANFAVPVGGAVAASSASAAHPVTWPRSVASLVLLTAAALFFAIHSWRRTSAQLIIFGVFPAGVLALSSVLVVLRPDPANSGPPVNPIPPSAQSIEIGQALYRLNCLQCHGANGRGDGAIGLALNPRPADLTIHTAPGVHPDGQLYAWITDGYPLNPVMPKFRERLNNDQRWHLVNYIRTFGQAVPPTATPQAGEPAARAALLAVEAAMQQLRSLRAIEVLRDGAGNALTTTLEFAAPDQVHLWTNTGAESIAIGGRQYARGVTDSFWQTWERDAPFVFPDFNFSAEAAEVRLEPEAELSGEPIRVIAFTVDTQEGPFAYQVFVDLQTGLARRLAMRAPGHDMVRDFVAYNPSVTIRPPPSDQIAPIATPVGQP